MNNFVQTLLRRSVVLATFCIYATYSSFAQTTLGGVNLGNLTNYHMVFTNGSVDANWQGATKGFAGNMAIKGTIATERTSGSVPFAGTIFTNDNTLSAWQGIVDQNAGQATASLNQSTVINGLNADLESAFNQINSLSATSGYSNVSSTSLNGLNTQNNINQTFVINITSGLQVSSQIVITGDAGDIFILRWDSDANFSNGYNGQVKFQSGGGIVPAGNLKPTNFINVAGDINSSGGGGNPPLPFPQGPRLNDGSGVLVNGGADFNGGGFFTGYWLTTGSPDNLDGSNQPFGNTAPLSNGIFVGGWYSKTNKFSMTSGTSGVFVSAPDCIDLGTCAPCVCTSNNMIVNGSMDVGNPPSSWITPQGAWGLGTGSNRGNYGVLNNGNTNTDFYAYQDQNATAGKPYTLNAWVASHGLANINAVAEMYLEFYNGSTKIGESAHSGTTLNFSGTLEALTTIAAIAPANTTKVRVLAHARGTALKFTDVTLTTCYGAVNLALDNKVDPNCNVSNGSITVTGSGGSGSYEYRINNGVWQTSNTFSGLTGITTGTNYTLDVRDKNALTCTKTLSVALTCILNCNVVISGIVTNVTTSGGTNGAINVSVTGGNAPYTYLWNDGVTTQDRINLKAGVYWVTVTDLLGCKKTWQFIITQPGDNCIGFCTQTQGGWGSKENGENPGVYRDANFVGAFPSGVTIGCGTKLLKLTTSQAVEDFLPSGSTPSVLPSGTLINVGSLYSNVLAGQVVALTLNVGFDNYDVNFGSSSTNLKNLIINSGTFSGKNVQFLLDEANKALGGCSSTYSLSDINNAVSSVNENYVNGTSTGGFLSCCNVPTPVITAKPGTTVCPDQSVGLEVSNCTGGVLLWNTGATSTAIVVVPSITTTYTVTCNVGNCTSASASIKITTSGTCTGNDPICLSGTRVVKDNIECNNNTPYAIWFNDLISSTQSDYKYFKVKTGKLTEYCDGTAILDITACAVGGGASDCIKLSVNYGGRTATPLCATTTAPSAARWLCATKPPGASSPTGSASGCSPRRRASSAWRRECSNR